MRQLILSIVVSMCLSGTAWAQSDEITATIGAQVEAFQADDLDRAFGYASPNIRRIFRTPENFGAMVQNGYPMVWRPTDLRFLELREIAGALWQKVQVTDAQGRVHLLDYQMINSGNEWKINAVQLLEPPQINV